MAREARSPDVWVKEPIAWGLDMGMISVHQIMTEKIKIPPHRIRLDGDFLMYVDCEARVEYVKYLYYFGMTHCRSHVAPNFGHVHDCSAAKHAKTASIPERKTA